MWESPGLAFLPYRIFGFIDCSNYWTNVPLSGTSGYFQGSLHRARYEISQRSVYTHFKQIDGIKYGQCLLQVELVLVLEELQLGIMILG